MTDDTNKTPGVVDDQVNYVEEMAKKFHKEDGSLDVEALAKGKWESDTNHVPTIEQENQVLRQELAMRKTLEDIVTQIKADEANASNPGNQPLDEDGRQVVSPQSVTDVQTLVRQTLEQERARQNQRTNVEYANQELSNMWGTGYQVRVSQKAQELGVTPEFLESMKSTHPKAFLRLVADQSPRGDPNALTPPRSQVSTPTNYANTGAKNYKYWQKVRKENPDYYKSVQGTRERERSAIDMGDSFYS